MTGNGGWGAGLVPWADAEAVRERLAAGADPCAALHAVGNTPLHEALWEEEASAEVVELLIEHGADVEAVNALGETPLWCAVRRRHADAARVLLDAGADAWRPVVGDRSAGRTALFGPLAEIFAGLPGAPAITEEERARQAEADALMAFYDRWEQNTEAVGIAFVAGLDLAELVRRVGRGTFGVPGDGEVWLSAPPEGGLTVLGGTIPVKDAFLAAVSAGGVAAATFDNPAGGDQRVHWWRDGERAGMFSPFQDPKADDPEEAWLCRFGEEGHPYRDMAQNLALMTLLTGVRADEDWLFEGPKVIVPIRR
ncbi:MAG TPA: ankyrin repeat domain-containing protein [Thermomonospora sp.]|nr:ankyrin repeat domain-containing protein [Thermomonospora sp.]